MSTKLGRPKSRKKSRDESEYTIKKISWVHPKNMKYGFGRYRDERNIKNRYTQPTRIKKEDIG